MVKHTPVPQFARSRHVVAGGMGEVHQGSMVTLERHTPQGLCSPPPGFPAATQERDAQVSGMASSSRGETPPVTVPSAPELAADPGRTARGIMAHINQMVDLMLMGPLAQYCEDEAQELY